MNLCHSQFARIGMAPNSKPLNYETNQYYSRNLLLILAAAILNCLLDGTMNLIVTICLCLALIPTARRMDRESRNQ